MFIIPYVLCGPIRRWVRFARPTLSEYQNLSLTGKSNLQHLAIGANARFRLSRAEMAGISLLRLVHRWSAAWQYSIFSFLRNFRDEGFRREHQGRDRGSILKGRTGHLGRIENTG